MATLTIIARNTKRNSNYTCFIISWWKDVQIQKSQKYSYILAVNILNIGYRSRYNVLR